MEEISIEKKGYSVWSAPQTFIATFLGGPLAGCYLISDNYKALNNPQFAKRALWSGVIGTAALFLLRFILEAFFPNLFEQIPPSVIAATACVLVLSHADIYQKKPIKELRKAGSLRNSYFKLIPVILVSILSMFALAFIYGMLHAIFFE